MELPNSRQPSTQPSRLKRVLTIFLPFALLICGGAYLIHDTEVQRIHEQRALQARETIIAGTMSITHTLQGVSRDLRYIASRPRNQPVLDEANEDHLSMLSSDWTAFSQAKQVYDKIRWIDERGMELLRVDYEAHGALVVWRSALQYKAHRYFFSETNKLSKNQIFVSPLDLNVELGEVELPPQPTIRFGTPVFDSQNNRRGFFLINYSASELLERFAQATRSHGRSNWLINQDGYWLKGAKPEDEFGFMFDRKEASLAQHYPNAWRKISSSEEGQFLSDVGLWTFSTVHPLNDWRSSQHGSAQTPNTSTKSGNYVWKHVSLMPASEFNAGVAAFSMKLAGSSAMLLLLFFWVSWRKVRTLIARELAEDDLRRKNHLLTNLTDHFPGAIYQLQLHPNDQLGFPFVSAGFRDIFGFEWEQVRGDASVFLNSIHPEDSEAVWYSIRRSADTLQPWHQTWRMTLPLPRGLRCFRGNAAPEKLEDGSILWHGFATDITEQKQAEENQRLASLVFQSSSEAILVTDEHNQIVSVNPAFEHMTGYSKVDVIGHNPRILGTDQHDLSFFESMWEALHTKGHWEGEFTNRHKSGELYIAHTMVNTIKNNDGSINYHVALASDVTHKKESERLIWQQANFDALTGLANRTMFRNQLELELRKADRTNLMTGLLLLDLDHFKDVNDSLGHDMGDMLLKMAAQRLRSCIRDSDIVARLGGDEFVIILGELAETSSVERAVNSILEQMASPFDLLGNKAYISTSIGVAIYPDDAIDIDNLIKNADQAMYAAKHEGRNRRNYFTQSMQDAALTKMQLVNDLRTANAKQQFILHYQPIVELTTGAICKAEALIRWQHPLRGLIQPNDFIPVAEETSIINEIGDWVFREATQQAAQWRQMHHPEFQVSINMSPVQFRQTHGFFEAWLAHMRQVDLPGNGIALEITEGLLLDASNDVNQLLLAFSEAHIQVVIDDFGTGYSSLSYIKKFDIDYIKIDQSFTANLVPGSSDLALCEAIIVMAHKLGLKVIAEGIETEEQRNLLTEINCDFGQGYLFAKPQPAHSFELMLAKDYERATNKP